MIVKTLLWTLTQKKMRTLLLLFSIAVCAALLFANLGFQNTVAEIVYNSSTRQVGNADLVITTRQSVGAEEWINPNLLSPFRSELVYDLNLIHGRALYAPSITEMHYFTTWGMDIDEFNTYNSLALQAGDFNNWVGKTLVIGTAYAQMFGLNVGDDIALEINGESHNFIITGISQTSGLFLRDLADGGYLLMPRDTLANIMGGQCNQIFLKANDTLSVSDLRQRLTDAFPQYFVRLGINHAVIQAEAFSYAMPFWMSSITVIIMGILIIYSSFNLIINERIKILGIMRSVGCTRRKTNRFLMLESMLIGAIGGMIGCVLGIGVLYVIKNLYYSGETAVVDAPMSFGIREICLTVAFTVIITALSAMLPIIRTTKMPIKNIMLNDFSKQRAKNARLWPIGICLLILCGSIPFLINDISVIGMIFASVTTVLGLIGMNMLIPSLSRLTVFLIKGIPHDLALGLRNAGDFKALLNNTRLFATMMAIMVFMMTLFNTLALDMRNAYQRLNYDIQVRLRDSNPENLTKLSQTDGVASFYGVYGTPLAISSHNSFINTLYGIDDSDFFDYFSAEIPADTLEAIERLGDGRYIVTTAILRDKLRLRIGDTLALQFENGVYDFQITGFLDSNWGIGHIGFISSENYITATGELHYSWFYVRADGDPNVIKSNILRSLSKDVLSISTKQELEAANADKVIGMFNSINTYAYFAMLIAIIGIINNLVACFLGRRRNLALYRCIGMSAKSTGRMLMMEAAAIGIIGTFAGLATGILLMQAIPLTVGFGWGKVAVLIPYGKITVMCIAGITLMLLCSVIPFIKGKNISIMDNIRYE